MEYKGVMNRTPRNIKKRTQNKTLKKRHRDKMVRKNEDFLKVLSILKENEKKKGEWMRARAYTKAYEAILKYKKDIVSLSQLEGVRYIGPSTLAHLKKYMETNEIEELESPVVALTNVFGIGPKKARALICEKNIKSIEELREQKEELLNDVQKKGLKYYEDFQKRIPREEIDAYKKILERYFNRFDCPKARFQIVGSYRRGAKDSGDIDIIITDITNDIYHAFIGLLQKKKIVIEILTKGERKSLAVSRLPNCPARRIDFLYAPPSEWPFALLYFTGCANLNVMMREKANELGYSLNEHGFTKDGEKYTERVFKDEEAIFIFLDLPYREPEERNNVMIKTKLEKLKKKVLKCLNMRQKLERLKEYGVTILFEEKEEELSKMLRHANKTYYNEKPILDDETYDILKEYILSEYPENEAVHEIGAPVEKNKVNLPYFMPSMDKIKPDTGVLSEWLENYENDNVISAKLDGVSAMYCLEDGVVGFYTRGDGKMGGDISYLAKYFDLPVDEEVVIRGELVMKKSVFAEKYGDASKARNLVAGIINSTKINTQRLGDVDFVAYELIKPIMKPSDQMEYLESLGIKTVINRLEIEISNEKLSEYLTTWRVGYEYEIDGIIVIDDAIYPREEENHKKNPEHAFAFKMVLGDQVAEVKVLDVLWEASMYGFLKPRLRIEPVKIGGALIEYVTAFNGGYVRDNKIGVGTVIKLVRSGDVIPHILEVVKSSDKPKMPYEPYRWTSTKVDVVLKDMKHHPMVSEKKITHFFKTLEVEQMGEGNVKRLVKAGYDTIPKILAMDMDELTELDGFGERKAKKIFGSIVSCLKEVSLPQLMKASGVFGRGMGGRRMKKILDRYPNILVEEDSSANRIEKIYEIKGFAMKTAKLFVRYIPLFLKFMEETGLKKSLLWSPEKKTMNHELSGKEIVMSGMRDGDLKKRIEKNGGKCGSSITSKTYALVVKNKEKETGKMKKAREKDVPIYTVLEFNERFGLE